MNQHIYSASCQSLLSFIVSNAPACTYRVELNLMHIYASHQFFMRTLYIQYVIHTPDADCDTCICQDLSDGDVAASHEDSLPYTAPVKHLSPVGSNAVVQPPTSSAPRAYCTPTRKSSVTQRNLCGAQLPPAEEPKEEENVYKVVIHI